MKTTVRRAKTATDAFAELEQAERRLAAERERVAAVRQGRRERMAEGAQLEEEIQAELFRAGADGRDPKGVDEARVRLTALQVQLADLARVEEGVTRAMRDAEGAVDTVRFEFAPVFQQALVEKGEKLEAERGELLERLADLRHREDAHRNAWRELNRVIPLAEPLFFGEDEVVPARFPTAPHPAMAALVAEPYWPDWFRAVQATTGYSMTGGEAA